MTDKPFMEKVIADLELILNNLPQPLLLPIWYPGVPPESEKLREALEQLGELLRKVAEFLVEAMKQEGFFDENPLIRVYPKYDEASGIIIYYKGRKVFEKWINAFEINWGDKQEVKQEVSSWYEDIRSGLEHDDYFDHYQRGPGGGDTAWSDSGGEMSDYERGEYPWRKK